MVQGDVQPLCHALGTSTVMSIATIFIDRHRLNVDVSAAVECILEDIGQCAAISFTIQLDHNPPAPAEEAGLAQILPGLALHILLEVLPAEKHSRISLVDHCPVGAFVAANVIISFSISNLYASGYLEAKQRRHAAQGAQPVSRLEF